MARWNHRDIARANDADEAVVRRIYAAVQTAKRQGLYGGHFADLVERDVGRKLRGGEYTVAAKAKEHLGYDPPGGYGGPKPRGGAKAPARPGYDDPKIARAQQLRSSADSAIDGVVRRSERDGMNAGDEDLLAKAADDLDVAADLYEEAGANVSAGTFRERARLARRVAIKLLAAYR